MLANRLTVERVFDTIAGMGSTVEALQQTLEAVAAVDLDTLTDGELDDELVALVRLRHRLDGTIARRAARWEASGVWRSDGSRAPWARLSRTASLSARSAKQVLRHGRAAASMPAATEAWAAGHIGADHVELLASAAGGRGDLYSRDETLLVSQCQELTFGQALKVVRYWCQRADAELDRDGPPPPKPSTVRLHTESDGRISGDFELDPVGGATVSEALRRIERDLYRQDQRDKVVRSTGERMAAALVELAVRSHTAPSDGRRPEPLLCILAGEATVEHLCELATGVVVTPDLIVPHLARCQVQTFIFDGADHVVAASRQRTFRGMLRRAVQVRDRHCQHPSGCDEPITHCDVDHRTPTSHGGVTAEANGELQCESHNRKSDLHGRQPADAIAAARHRRHLEHLARQRLAALIADQASRPPPQAA
jgi:hypothetical protein